jgi:hypothetical protein
MRINRKMLLRLADDAVEKYANEDHSVMAIYLQGSLLGASPLMGNTADIDLFLIHSDEALVEREIVRLSDEVHLDISHHSHMLYRQPRELRLHPWLGPAVYGCKILYDPQHFLDFVQASVRGQFNDPSNVMIRVQKQARNAREMWRYFNDDPHTPTTQDIALYLRALEHAADAVAGLNRQNLTERRFLLEFAHVAEAVDKAGMYKGFLGLLGAPALDEAVLQSWLSEWEAAYGELEIPQAPVRLQPQRLLYYKRAIEVMLSSHTPLDALWPLWHTWTHIVGALPAESPHYLAWQNAGEQLGLFGDAFTDRISGLDAYLDMVEELLEVWARENGV